jgi:5-methylcytosine-specific restriction endonuclease McrA
MRRLASPKFNFNTALAESIRGIGDANIRAYYETQITNPDAIALETLYEANARVATLYQFPRLASISNDGQVHGNLTKSDLIKLYTQYFVPKGKPARYLYDLIKITANGKCPFCGDIGHVRTLDHYLPKANFPLYSIMPSNLIPCCRDCNTEKSNAFSITAEEQTLHPYFDDDKFFSQQWVAARVIQGTPPVIEYFVSPPNGWTNLEKRRVEAHFEEYQLAERFGVEAGADLPETIFTRQTILQGINSLEYAEHLSEKSNKLNVPVNNWRRVMFACLADDPWFCGHPH